MTLQSDERDVARGSVRVPSSVRRRREPGAALSVPAATSAPRRAAGCQSQQHLALAPPAGRYAVAAAPPFHQQGHAHARHHYYMGHDKTRSGADLCGASLLVNFDHVIDPHFVTFSSSLYTTIRSHKPNRNPTVTTDRQIGPRDSQIVTVQIRPTDPSRSAFCRMPYYIRALVTAISVTNCY